MPDPTCTDPSGCNSEEYSKGLCKRHYHARLRKTAEPKQAARHYIAQILMTQTTPEEIARLLNLPEATPADIAAISNAVQDLITKLQGDNPPQPSRASGPQPRADSLRGPGRSPWRRRQETPLKELPLHQRTLNALQRAGHFTVRDVFALEDYELRDIRRFGVGSIEDLREALHRHP